MVYINGDDGYNNRANNSDGNNSDLYFQCQFQKVIESPESSPLDPQAEQLASLADEARDPRRPRQKDLGSHDI